MKHVPACSLLISSLLGAGPAAGAGESWPAPRPLPAAEMGVGIQRTMTLLATSTPQRPNTVRILFYGQSITEQEWWKMVAEDLRRRFPHARLHIENRAIGGFAAQRLVLPAEHDLYPFYPDLLIFHVYGDHREYERIIRRVRSRTTAEVLMQKDHVTKWPAPPFDPAKDKGMWWDDLMNNRFLPEIAARYRCGLVDVRSAWLDYLRTNRLEPAQLLRDGVHLNAHGNYLLAELIKQYLVHRPDLPQDSWRDLVRTYEQGRDFVWREGRMRLEFEGNRVDVEARLPAGRRVCVLIDGRKPSEFPGCYAITRPQPGPWSPLALVRVDHERPLVLEDWSLTITDVSPDGKRWSYSVRGSITGPDGDGRSDAVFVSASGRVKIDPAAWFANGGPRVGYAIRWKVVPMFADVLEPAQGADEAGWQWVTVAQGLPNGPHVLELAADEPAGIAVRSIRAYRPPFREE